MKPQNLYRKVGRALPKIKELAAKVAARIDPLLAIQALALIVLVILFAGRVAV